MATQRHQAAISARAESREQLVHSAVLKRYPLLPARARIRSSSAAAACSSAGSAATDVMWSLRSGVLLTTISLILRIRRSYSCSKPLRPPNPLSRGPPLAQVATIRDATRRTDLGAEQSRNIHRGQLEGLWAPPYWDLGARPRGYPLEFMGTHSNILESNTFLISSRPQTPSCETAVAFGTEPLWPKSTR